MRTQLSDSDLTFDLGHIPKRRSCEFICTRIIMSVEARECFLLRVFDSVRKTEAVIKIRRNTELL